MRNPFTFALFQNIEPGNGAQTSLSDIIDPIHVILRQIKNIFSFIIVFKHSSPR